MKDNTRLEEMRLLEALIVNTESRETSQDAKNKPGIPRTKLDPNSHSIRLELDVLTEEYRIINEKISERLDADERSYELTVITFGAIVAASSFVITQGAYSLLLVLSVPFHVLVWEQIRRSILGIILARYLVDNIALRINEIIQKTATDIEIFGDPVSFLSWEKYVGQKTKFLNRRTPVGIASLLPKAGKTILQLSASATLVASYLFLAGNNAQYNTTYFDVTLLISNIIFWLISLASLFVFYQYQTGAYEKDSL